MPLDELQPLHTSVAAALQAIKRIDTAVTEHAGTELAPSLDRSRMSLGRIEQYLGKQLARPAGHGTRSEAEARRPEGGAAALGAITVSAGCDPCA